MYELQFCREIWIAVLLALPCRFCYNTLMTLNHAGIINKDEEQALRFYRDFLGLEHTRGFTLPSELSEQLFDVSLDIRILVFEKDGTKLEVFISPEYRPAHPDFGHVGLFVEDLSAIIEKAPLAGVELIQGRTKEKTVYFIRDFSGNLIEIKQM